MLMLIIILITMMLYRYVRRRFACSSGSLSLPSYRSFAAESSRKSASTVGAVFEAQLRQVPLCSQSAVSALTALHPTAAVFAEALRAHRRRERDAEHRLCNEICDLSDRERKRQLKEADAVVSHE